MATLASPMPSGGGLQLSRELVLDRTKSSTLREVKRLNAWGVGISEIDVLQECSSLEILSLSVNNIHSLHALAACTNLCELYLRRNNICDLDELQHLVSLPRLRVLWLAENPCADDPHYRYRVLHKLPNLEKLDDLEVTEDEHAQATALFGSVANRYPSTPGHHSASNKDEFSANYPHHRVLQRSHTSPPISPDATHNSFGHSSRSSRSSRSSTPSPPPLASIPQPPAHVRSPTARKQSTRSPSSRSSKHRRDPSLPPSPPVPPAPIAAIVSAYGGGSGASARVPLSSSPSSSLSSPSAASRRAQHMSLDREYYHNMDSADTEERVVKCESRDVNIVSAILRLCSELGPRSLGALHKELGRMTLECSVDDRHWEP